MADEPRVTVVVITRDRCAELLHTLDRLRALPDRPPVIVVDNASSDDTRDRVSREHPWVTLIPAPENLAAAGRNLGAAQARTPYVAFSDDDTWWADDALSTAADVLDAHPDLALLTARVLVGAEEREDPVSAIMARSPLPRDGGPGVPVLGFLACATVVRRRPFLAVGGFHRQFLVGGEEELLAIDLAVAGWRLAYLAELSIHHHPSLVRDPPRRQVVLARNRLWTVWLRRPLPSAAARTFETLRTTPPVIAARALTEALRGLPWVLRERRSVPPDVEAALRAVETAG